MIVSAKNIFRLKFCLLLLVALATNVFSQSGGSYQLTSSAINGGGETSTGGSYTLDGSIGQPAAESLLRNPPYSLQSGFMPTTLTFTAPTAADSIISGRIMASNGLPIGGVVVTLSGSRSARTITNGAGEYSFSDIETGGFYAVTPTMANLSFSPSSRSFSLVANKTDADFTASAAAIAANPLDTDLFFVRQQYLDFLGREPDRGGLDYWSGELEKCGLDQSCLNSRRIGISAAFFIESEFQQTGSFVYRLYKAALGRQIVFAEFSADRRQALAGSNLDASKAAFATAFVQRPEFSQKYSDATSAEGFVNVLLQTVQQSSGVDLSGQRSALLARYNSGQSMNESRSLALREAVEHVSFQQAVYNSSFVLMQYFGYLQRDPDEGGYRFWLNVLNNKEPNNYRGMVCSFITSAEYQQRFSAAVTRSNSQCGH